MNTRTHPLQNHAPGQNHTPGQNTPGQSHTSRQRGFTLVELVVTMVIAAILAAVAIPAYSNYVRKAHRTEAKSTLLDMASLEERYFSANNTYTQTPADLGYAGLATPFPVGSGYYNITTLTMTPAAVPTAGAPAGTPAQYTITATPVAGSDQAKDTSCTSFSINSQGQQTATGSSTASVDCWK